MNADEISAAIAYANMLDGRVQINEARVDLWTYHLRHMPATACRAAILEHYGRDLKPGEREIPPISPADIRKLASKYRPRCEEHDDWPVDRCLPCRDEIADGNRPSELYGRKKAPDAKPQLSRLAETMRGIGQTPV